MFKDDYFTDLNAMSMPWVESPFFDILLDQSKLSNEDKKLAKNYNKNGYIIIDVGLSDKEILAVNDDVNKILQSDKFEGQERYEYTDHRRLFQLWKKSENIKKLTLNKNILDTLRLLYGREPFPFSTINFTNPTSQPLHSDSIHFNSYPKGWMVGVWVAFEDCDKNNGTLRIVEGSHKWPQYDYNDIKIKHPDTRIDGEKKSYREYDLFVKRLVQAKGAKEKSINIKKGNAIIWASNLLHGGTPIANDKVSRKSQAIHYFFNGCKKYYTPMFSEPMLGKYAEKWCNEKENIFTYREKG
jgi:ectoine hydroxylase-related dioxygenase (phytanoyl-CoA dioxygenase family)